MLKPKFDLIEKRVIVPIYGVKGGIPSEEKVNARKIKIENFNKKELCNRILKTLETDKKSLKDDENFESFLEVTNITIK